MNFLDYKELIRRHQESVPVPLLDIRKAMKLRVECGIGRTGFPARSSATTDSEAEADSPSS